jgi:predicted nucleotidyltransferase
MEESRFYPQEGHSNNDLSPLQIPTIVSKEDCEQIQSAVKRALDKRKDVIDLLATLEGAWTTAVRQELTDYNSQPIHSDLPESLQEAEDKKREIKSIENGIFSCFESLTKEKHQSQILLGQKILDSLPTESVENMIEVTNNTKTFFENEARIHKVFLSRMENLNQKTDFYLEEINRVSSKKCNNDRLEELLATDLKLLKSFLIATKKLLNQ